MTFMGTIILKVKLYYHYHPQLIQYTSDTDYSITIYDIVFFCI